jgi:hypothetical protein
MKLRAAAMVGVNGRYSRSARVVSFGNQTRRSLWSIQFSMALHVATSRCRSHVPIACSIPMNAGAQIEANRDLSTSLAFD